MLAEKLDRVLIMGRRHVEVALTSYVVHDNEHRPHRSLPHRATPATLYDTMPKALPGPSRDTDTHDRIRHDVVDKSGTVTLRVAGQLRHIGIGRTHSRTHVILLIQDLDVRVVNAITGELPASSPSTPARTTNPRNDKIRTHFRGFGSCRCPETSHGSGGRI